MRLPHWILLFAVGFATYTFGATPETKAPVKKAVPKKGAVAGKTSATAGKTTPKTTGKGVATKRATRRTAPAMARQSRQQTPAPERYREIQQALTDKGYLKSEPTGVWTTESADALKQFQTENNLSPTGKLSAASLISLGLGPKKNTEPIVPPAVPANPTPVRP
jgi:peptidoglycan hydrolase-like protein with peptidoglycan-binding domain